MSSVFLKQFIVIFDFGSSLLIRIVNSNVVALRMDLHILMSSITIAVDMVETFLAAVINHGMRVLGELVIHNIIPLSHILDLLHSLLASYIINFGQLKGRLALIADQAYWVDLVGDFLASHMRFISLFYYLFSPSAVALADSHSHLSNHIPVVLALELFL